MTKNHFDQLICFLHTLRIFRTDVIKSVRFFLLLLHICIQIVERDETSCCAFISQTSNLFSLVELLSIKEDIYID